MAAMKYEDVDVVVTSPPYNLGIAYRKYNDHQQHGIYMNWTRSWMRYVDLVLRQTGSFFLNLGGSPKKPLLPYQILLQAVEEGWAVQNVFHWIKSLSVDKKDGTTESFGHFKPIISKRFVNDCHEFVFHLTKAGTLPVDRLALGVPYADKSNVKRWGHTDGRDRRCRGNVWYIPYKTIQNRAKQRKHPATFPVKLAENCIRIHGGNLEKLHVCDPFVGVGNSAVAAVNLQVSRFTGFDIDEFYVTETRDKIT